MRALWLAKLAGKMIEEASASFYIIANIHFFNFANSLMLKVNLPNFLMLIFIDLQMYFLGCPVFQNSGIHIKTKNIH